MAEREAVGRLLADARAAVEQAAVDEDNDDNGDGRDGEVDQPTRLGAALSEACDADQRCWAMMVLMMS
jgi:hypothetical protein